MNEPIEQTSRTLLDDLDSDIDSFMNDSYATTAALSFKIPQTMKPESNLSRETSSKENSTIAHLEKQVAELTYANNRLVEQKLSLENQLDHLMSEMSELGSTRHQAQSEVNFLLNYHVTSLGQLL
jgi:chromosome segregation ATPase